MNSIYFRVGGVQALRIEPGRFSDYNYSETAQQTNSMSLASVQPLPGLTPNWIGGSHANYLQGSYSGVVIAGGGSLEGSLGGPDGSHVAGGNFAVISGGYGNAALADSAVVSGGERNYATGAASTIAGGRNNEAAGDSAFVAGGSDNQAVGDFSFAAGTRALALHRGATVFADNSSFQTFTSSATNEFSVRAVGGVRFVSNAPGTAGVRLAPGAGSWSILSDRASKKNLTPVDGEAVLKAIARMPISRWSYLAQADGIRHMGPMAQDFRAAFGLGEDDTSISTVDADGVNLAAIQALEVRTAALQREIAELKNLIAELLKRP